MQPKNAYSFFALLLATTSAALPPLIDTEPSLFALNATTKDAWPFCFTRQSHPGIEATNLQDCTGALRALVREPNFLVPFEFSKNSRRGIKLPKGWKSGQCGIFVSCANDHDADKFTYADVAHQARKVIQGCVDNRAMPYGGMDLVGAVGTFYVSIGRPTVHRSVALEVKGVNGAALVNDAKP